MIYCDKKEDAQKVYDEMKAFSNEQKIEITRLLGDVYGLPPKNRFDVFLALFKDMNGCEG